MYKQKSQGEIFGIALMFVIIISGIIIYGQIKTLEPNRELNVDLEKRYTALAEGTLNTILRTSTNCYVERGHDTIKDLITYCLESTYSGNDPELICNDGTVILACSQSVNFLNKTLQTLFKKKAIGNIPYFLSIRVPANTNSLLNNITLTNFGIINQSGKIIRLENYRKLGYKRATSGLRTWATIQRDVRLNLRLYYK